MIKSLIAGHKCCYNALIGGRDGDILIRRYGASNRRWNLHTRDRQRHRGCSRWRELLYSCRSGTERRLELHKGRLRDNYTGGMPGARATRPGGWSRLVNGFGCCGARCCFIWDLDFFFWFRFSIFYFCRLPLSARPFTLSIRPGDNDSGFRPVS